MATKLNNKKMAALGLLIALVGTILVAFAGYIYNTSSIKTNRERT
jgi:hypothetical protein